MDNNMYNNYIPNHGIINDLPTHENYVTDYLQHHLGKRIKAHVSFCDSIEWRDSIFKGTLKKIGKDYIVITDNNEDYVIWSLYIDYIIIQ